MERFAGPPLALPARLHRELVETVAGAGLTGGAIYDALIAATARHAGATLITRDQRAIPVYDRLRARYEILA